jgi:hypothetical protein
MAGSQLGKVAFNAAWPQPDVTIRAYAPYPGVSPERAQDIFRRYNLGF